MSAMSPSFDSDASSYMQSRSDMLELAARHTVALADLRSGESVLDLACGAGTTALPAAEAVAPDGSVVGVDLDEQMLEIGRAEQKRRGITNLEFRQADMSVIEYAPESFDAVICQFGIYFVPEPQATAGRLWRLLRPGGRLVLVVPHRANETPMRSVWCDAVRAEDADLVPEPAADSPLARTSEVEPMRQLLLAAGIGNPTITVERQLVPIASPDAAWSTLEEGASGRVLRSLESEAAARVRSKVLKWLVEGDVRAIENRLLCAVARK